MIELARPAFLWAGALAAAIPLLLHFLRPRERSRRVLPTLRFLTEESRVRIHLARRPDELLLLLLRMGLCLLLGAAFAGASWIGPEEGTGVLVVVDMGAGVTEGAGAEPGAGAESESLWDEEHVQLLIVAAIDGVQHPIASVTLVRVGAHGAPELRRLAPVDADDPEAWAGFGPTEGEVRLAHLLRALRDDAARATGFDSLAARIVTVPRWTAWGIGLPELRAAHWPGAIELVVPAVPRRPPPVVVVGWEAPEPFDTPLQRALEVLGLGTGSADDLPESDLPESEFPGSDAPGMDHLAPSPDTLRITVSLGPEDTLGDLWLPGDPGVGASARGGGAFLLLDGRTLDGAGPPPGGTPGEGAAVPVLRGGGIPAGAARREGGACDVVIPLGEDAGILRSGELALLLESAIAEGCGITPAILAGIPDDAESATAAWTRLLQEGGLPGVVDAASVRGEEAGFPLTRLLLALALLVVLLETLWVRASEARRAEPVGGPP